MTVQMLNMECASKIHQIFFKFDHRELHDYPVFVESYNAFRRMPGWEYRLWNEEDVEHLCKRQYPRFWETYRTLKYDIMRVDAAKYMIADSFPYSFIADLDVVPSCHLDEFINTQPYVFDRCSRRSVICNDFFFVGAGGLPGIFEYFVSNLARVDAIPCYKQRLLRYVFHASGPDFWTRYLKRQGLDRYVAALSDRTFLEKGQEHRNVSTATPYLNIIHHLSWVTHVRPKGARVSRSTARSEGAPASASAS